ncbi:putative permease YjgP/YjgQ family protein [Tautonia plasticadhaerens]|uniref:Putative permease YjgP/YjgQ family protein n=2 Tax=Tautonia plasticadhaerens TaxID=2527974 RepID=A0A518H3K3_9BACT|nr:putative permease YjgP/YjgQ family protein [Tautonia plasticadhaerens]
MAQVAKAFSLALLMLTSIFVLVVVVAKAADVGLGPREIAMMLPLAVPSTLPYTAPVSLLFAVSVVYGRIASDNEVLAVKASGQGAMTMMLPSFLVGAILSGGLIFLSNDLIPRATHQTKVALLSNLEEHFYRILKKERSFDNPLWPFKIEVEDVEDKTLVGARFSHRNKSPEAESPFDLYIFAERAAIRFDKDEEKIVVGLEDAYVIGDHKRPDFVLIDKERLELPMPGNRDMVGTVQELTTGQIMDEQELCMTKSVEDRRRQSVAASLWIASGRPRLVNWGFVRQAFIDYDYFEHRYDKLETEKQMRVAIAFSPLFFVLLGTPVGIWRARGDFLTAFMVCFLPIITIYYPLTLFGVNLGKEGMVEPLLALWAGNLVLAVLCGLVLRPVLRH